ncbi:hypothetical protein [Ancylomarina sp. 16SWW S1-10-2]|uniref:hypothetical protein n=1 Tax=Ancylomarina sp. 16SWW S1-10-2 TaxID=2499681 RepID=UPI0012AE5098|nr:hypothetical protein [Ancylomarina sp. 16SWW S1-10-2]MRT92277.1 hypothetical protein [Ancylomarina sp. 16SWW S1-10-2]
MIDITKKLPISLITLLNSFNEKLIPFRKQIELDAVSSKVSFNNISYENIKTSYKIKNSSFSFEINFIIDGDYIDWNYYPNAKDSSKKTNQKKLIFNQKICDQLKADLEKWKENISIINELVNPIDFFLKDKIIEFYSKEVQEKMPFNEYEEEFPLSSEKQDLAVVLIDKQVKFLEQELKSIKDKTTEKYQDLNNAKANLSELKEDMSQMTISEVKRKWSLSFGTIIKWSKKKFIQFMSFDKASGNDISRLIGSFLGGVFGVPKLE